MTDKVIIALDFGEYEDARQAIDRLPEASCFKVGLQAFIGFGERILGYLLHEGKTVFLDLKFSDIPNTVTGAIRSCFRYNPRFLTIHLSGGREMVRTALETAAGQPGLTVLGVTLLTSLAEDDLAAMGTSLSPSETVLRMCEFGIHAGMKGFVCSPREIEPIRKRFGRDIVLVTPGIRPEWAEKNDQKRVCSPRMAMAAGSDYLVIGRPITHHPSPAEAFRLILQEMATVKTV